MSLWKYFEGPEGDVRLHRLLVLVWSIQLPLVFAPQKLLIPYLVFVSLYANIATHWGALVAAKAEVQAHKSASKM